MLRKSAVGLAVLLSVVPLAFIAPGCAKKQLVREETAGGPVVEGKKEDRKPEIAREAGKSKEEAPQPGEAAPVGIPKEKVKEEAKEENKIELKEEPLVEARPEEKPPPFDLSSFRIQFAFDDYNLSSQAKENLEKIASWMSKNPAAKIQIEGHTCEIGTNEYNLALGERRASGAQRYLEALGVDSRRISTISYGAERPLDPGHSEEARSRNRRDEFVETK